MSFKIGAVIIKKLFEIADDEKTRPATERQPFYKIDPTGGREIDGYISLPYLIRRDVFEKVFVKELKLEECQKAFDRVQSQPPLVG